MKSFRRYLRESSKCPPHSMKTIQYYADSRNNVQVCVKCGHRSTVAGTERGSRLQIAKRANDQRYTYERGYENGKADRATPGHEGADIPLNHPHLLKPSHVEWGRGYVDGWYGRPKKLNEAVTPVGHIRLYHGTLRRHVPSIQQQGLTRPKGDFIWATESESFAREFAIGLTYGTNEPPQPAVIEFTVPRTAVSFERPYTPGKRDPVGTRVARITLDTVPPEWILSVK